MLAWPSWPSERLAMYWPSLCLAKPHWDPLARHPRWLYWLSWIQSIWILQSPCESSPAHAVRQILHLLVNSYVTYSILFWTRRLMPLWRSFHGLRSIGKAFEYVKSETSLSLQVFVLVSASIPTSVEFQTSSPNGNPEHHRYFNGDQFSLPPLVQQCGDQSNHWRNILYVENYRLTSVLCKHLWWRITLASEKTLLFTTRSIFKCRWCRQFCQSLSWVSLGFWQSEIFAQWDKYPVSSSGRWHVFFFCKPSLLPAASYLTVLTRCKFLNTIEITIRNLSFPWQIFTRDEHQC